MGAARDDRGARPATTRPRRPRSSEKKSAEVEAAKIERDKHEAASYAIQLNKSRKEFETKLQILKMRKGTLATQIAAARSAGGDAFGNDSSVWDKFKAAEDRIDSEAIETEVDAAMRGEEVDAARVRCEARRGVATTPACSATPDGPEDALAKLKAKMDDATRRRSRRRSRRRRKTEKK